MQLVINNVRTPCVHLKVEGIRISSIVSIVVGDGVQLPSKLTVGLDDSDET